MAVYRYAPSRRYRPGRYAYRSRRRGTVTVPPWLVITAGVVALAGAGAGTKAVTSHAHAKAKPPAVTGNSVAAQVTAFARARVGKVPYAWGGTTDAGMDCSGLAQSAYASAGVTIERTSQDQWASERHVAVPVAGDLVFFAGSDGTASAPGHVGIVTDPARHLMIDAFGSGTYVRAEGYGAAASPGTGLEAVVGFTDPDPAPAAPAGGEAAFTAALLSALSAPATRANETSLAAWYHREQPYWGAGPASDPLSVTLPEPGSASWNGSGVQAYPSAAEGVRATAANLSGGYPAIVSALRSGGGICGTALAGDLSEWSGGAYTEVC